MMFGEVLIRNDFTLMNDDHPIADGFHFLQNMGRKKNGAVPTIILYHIADLDNLIRIETRGRFIQYQHFR